MEGTTAFAAFSSVLAASSPNLAERGFEICALDARSNSLLKTVQQVAVQLDEARALLRQKSAFFNEFEKRMFDGTFKNTEDAICHVAALAERPSGDMELAGGRLRVGTRVLFVLRDSPTIQVSLSQLGMASQGLKSIIIQLSGRGLRQSQTISHAPPSDSPPVDSPFIDSPPVQESDVCPPPTYEESIRDLVTKGRRRNMARRASAMALAAAAASPPQERMRSSSSLSAPILTVPVIPELDIPELAANESHRPMSMPNALMTDLDGLPSRSYRLSPDMSIPEVMQPFEQVQHIDTDLSPKPSRSRQSSIDLRNENANSSSTPLGRRVDGGRRTGRARAESWLEARALR